MWIHWNFMQTTVSFIGSVPWPFLICNITILKKDLAVSFLGILFSFKQSRSGCVSGVYQLNSRCHIYSILSLNNFIRSSCLSFSHTCLFWLSREIIEATWLAMRVVMTPFCFFLINSFSCECIQWNFIKMAVPLIIKVLWPFLICNIYWKMIW